MLSFSNKIINVFIASLFLLLFISKRFIMWGFAKSELCRRLLLEFLLMFLQLVNVCR